MILSSRTASFGEYEESANLGIISDTDTLIHSPQKETTWMPAPLDVRAPREQNSWQHQPHRRHSLQHRGDSVKAGAKMQKQNASPFQEI